MADDVDMTHETMEREAALRAKYLTQRGMEAEAVGKCLYCHTPFEGAKINHRWCDADCRDGWQAEQRR